MSSFEDDLDQYQEWNNEDLSDWGEDDDQNSHKISTTHSKNNSYLTQDELFSYIMELCQQFMDIYDCDINNAVHNMIQNSFDISKCLYPSISSFTSHSSQTHDCSTAFCDNDCNNTLSLGCLHYYCDTCWNNYLSSEINHANPIFIKCMESKCKIIAPFSFIRETVCKDDIDKWKRMIVNIFMDKANSHIWCPDGCGYIIDKSLIKQTIFTCKCGSKVCLLCSSISHYPAPCDIYNKWKALEKSSDATQVWLETRTKECPICKTRIEKDSGCHHMHCFKCKYHFCWLCMKEWQTHGYGKKCIEKDDYTEEKIEKNGKILGKYYLHYIKFKNFEKMAIAIKQKRTYYMELQDIAIKYFLESIDLVIDCFKMLQYIQAVLYYMKESKEKNLILFQCDLIDQQIAFLIGIINKDHDITDLLDLKFKYECQNLTSIINKYFKELALYIEVNDHIISNIVDAFSTEWGCIQCETINSNDIDFCKNCSTCKIHQEKNCIMCKRTLKSQGKYVSDSITPW